MSFELTILGCNSAVPAFGRHPSAQILKSAHHKFLIDCGEGTQVQLSKYKIKRGKIQRIFISHMHGDHYYGLMGLLSTYHLNGRTDDIHIYGPPILEEIIQLNFRAADSEFAYKIVFHPISFDQENIIFEDDTITVSSFPVHHRIPTCGFKFVAKSIGKKINAEGLKEHNIPNERIPEIRLGKDIEIEGKTIQNEWLTLPDEKPLSSYAYTADTALNDCYIDAIKDVQLLYHDCTFAKEFQERAKNTFHSTSHDAAKAAKKAGVQQLIIGHYSAKYKDLEFLKEEAQEIFPNTALAKEGKVYEC